MFVAIYFLTLNKSIESRNMPLRISSGQWYYMATKLYFLSIMSGEVFVALEGPFGINLGQSRGEVFDQMSSAITNFTANNHEDVDSAVQLMTVYLSNGMGQLINATFGNTANRKEPDSLQPFLDMPNQVPFMTHSGHTKLNDFVHKVSEFQAKGYR
jgi:hypothetical protein